MNKRKLQFASLNEAVAQLDQLIANGYVTKGKWNLAQVATHLELWLSFPMDGFPNLGTFAPVMWLIRKTVGPRMLKSILADGFTQGTSTLPATVPEPDCNTDSAAVEKLKTEILRFEQFTGKLYPSPLFGALDKPTAMKLQLRHFEHHIGFLQPKR